jgi:hypothetical protein
MLLPTLLLTLMSGALLPAVAGAEEAVADTTGSLRARLQARERDYFSAELLQGGHTFRDTSVARFDSLGLEKWSEVVESRPLRVRLSYDPAFRLWNYQRTEGLVAASGAILTVKGNGRLELLGQGGYATGPEKFRYFASVDYSFDVGATSHSVRVEAADRVVAFGSNRPTANFLFAFTAGVDEQDYLRRRGGRVSWWSSLGAHLGLGVEYDAAQESSVPWTTEFALFGKMDEANPDVDAGIDRGIVARARLRFLQRRMRFDIAHRIAGGGLGGDFTYNRTLLQLDWRFYAWRRQELVTRFVGVHNAGTPTFQQLGDAGGLSSVRGYDRRTRVGEQSLTGRVEWLVPYDLFRATNVPGLRRLHLQFVPWGDAGRVWNGTSNEWIQSAGLGIQRFLGTMGPVSNLRFDFAFPVGPERPDDFRFMVQFTSSYQ